jgi:2-polyprenyl-6-hydroxyphenyl methylase/3-demethylubiquinone-9 3-methyltransferase
MMSTADNKEMENFAALSDRWWDQQGPMAPLHAFTPVRIDYILRAIRRFFPENGTGRGRPLAGRTILDIGCGGGLLAEPMARLGATVTGIDITEPAVAAATRHAAQMRLPIDYRCMTAEALAQTGTKFDVIYASEVIEHIASRPMFIKAIAEMLAPDGVVIITTINRTVRSLLLAKIALEYVVRLVPRGTHDPQKFVRPDELRREFAAVGIMLDDMVGFAPRLGGGFSEIGSLAVNYAASGGFRRSR